MVSSAVAFLVFGRTRAGLARPLASDCREAMVASRSPMSDVGTVIATGSILVLGCPQILCVAYPASSPLSVSPFDGAGADQSILNSLTRVRSDGLMGKT